jgi:hypothetical protein
LIKALASKCQACILSTDVKSDDSSSSADGDMFQATYKELSKWEDVEKSDANWELLVHKHNQAKRWAVV